jgi:hypothetical protein
MTPKQFRGNACFINLSWWFMPVFIRLSLLILIAIFSHPSYAQGSDVRTVLDTLIHSYGGENNLQKLDSMVQEWDMVALMRKTHGTDTRSIQAPGKLRVDLSYPEKSETRILNGDIGHVIFEGKSPERVSGMQLIAMQLQSMRLYSPLMLRNKIDSVSLIEQGGLLALSLVENGVHVHYMVNKDKWLIEKVAGTIIMNGGEIQFLTEYSDFSVVEGVLMHHKENKFAAGMNTAVLQLRKVTFDVKFDASRFRP